VLASIFGIASDLGPVDRIARRTQKITWLVESVGDGYADVRLFRELSNYCFTVIVTLVNSLIFKYALRALLYRC
jgi:hypothetical protein